MYLPRDGWVTSIDLVDAYFNIPTTRGYRNCNEGESQTSTLSVHCSRSTSHGSRCSVNELEDTVGLCIATTSSVTMGAREGPTGPVRTDPHCHTLAPGDLVPTTVRDVGTISTLDTQHFSVTIPASRSDPSRSDQSPATRVESIRGTLCSRVFSVDVASRVGRPQREFTLGIYESKWRIFFTWCNIQHINPLSATESVVSDFLLHLHTEKHLANSTIAGYQIASTLRATTGAEEGRNLGINETLYYPQSLGGSGKRLWSATQNPLHLSSSSTRLRHTRQASME